MASALELYAQEIERLALTLTDTAKGHFDDWTDVFYETCLHDSGSGAARTIVKNHDVREDIHPSHEVNECSTALSQLRDQILGGPWCCLSMHVTRDGEVDVQYGYDPDWMNRFFDDYEKERPF